MNQDQNQYSQSEEPPESKPTVLSGMGRSGQPLIVTIVLLVLFFGFGLGAGYLVWGKALASTNEQLDQTLSRALAAEALLQEIGAVPQAQQENIDPNAPREVVRYPVSEGDGLVYGPADAPITIIEFSDYECPFCTRWHAEVWPRLQEAYPDQVRLVYRDFPLYSIHPNAGPAAEAARCAGEQGSYWEFHELLFNGGQQLSRAGYETNASQLGLDLAGFKACLDEKRYEQAVLADFEYARQLGVQSTPTFFINGIALIGAQPFEIFQEVIELELAGKLSK